MKIKTSKASFNKLYHYINHAGAITNEHERYEDFNFFFTVEITGKNLLCGLYQDT